MGDEAPLSFDDLIFARRKTEIKRQSETATEALPELESPGGAEPTPELLDARELFTANEEGLRAPNQGEVTLPKWRTQPARLRKLRLLWATRRLMLHWATTGCCAAILLALAVPKQYVSSEVDTAGSTIGQQFWWVWFDWGRFNGRQQH